MDISVGIFLTLCSSGHFCWCYFSVGTPIMQVFKSLHY